MESPEKDQLASLNAAATDNNEKYIYIYICTFITRRHNDVWGGGLYLVCRAVRLTGPFVTMVYSMITGDMLTFGIIYMVVLFGFSQSFYFLYKGFPGVKSSLYHSYHSTWMALFQITLGDYSVS